MERYQNNVLDRELQIDLRAWLFKLLRNWWLFALLIGASLGVGYLYLRYATYEYATKAVLLIKDAGNSTVISEESILLADQGFINSGRSLDNEIQILKSIPLMEKVIRRIHGHINYFRQGVIKENEIDNFSPFLLDTFLLNNGGAFGGCQLFLEINDHNRFNVKMAEDDEYVEQVFGEPFSNDYGYFKISKKLGAPFVEFGNYRISVTGIELTAMRYANQLRVELVGNPNHSGILELKLQDPVPQKSERIINTLIQVYNEEEITDENKVLRNTLNFIDQRVDKLTNELDSVEGALQQFKRRNAIITEDASSSLNFTLEEMRSSVQRISELEIRQGILESLEQYLLENQNANDLIPANFSNGSVAIGQIIERYNEKLLRWEQLSSNATEVNPARIALERELNDLRSSIMVTLQNSKKELEIPLQENRRIIDRLSQQMGSIPGVEKELLEQIRTQGIKENLFLYLLQRREETALSQAVTTANTRVIDWARSTKFPIYPRSRLVYIGCFLIGAILPLIILIITNSLATKVDSEDAVKRLTTIPIIGKIVQHHRQEKIVVLTGNRSAISEMFRLLRTNLNYIIKGHEKPVIMVTSSTSSEGKTFVTLNLGMTLALSNKKVVVLGMDLRRPKLFEYLNQTKNHLGITNYLIGENEWNEIINISEYSDQLHFITSGPIPPNPAELMLQDRISVLIEQLKEHYDYILIDTPPMGIVADALLLRNLVSNTLIVIRQGHTRKAMVNDIEEMHLKEELTNPSLILNGIKIRAGYYGYGYHYGYYEKNS